MPAQTTLRPPPGARCRRTEASAAAGRARAGPGAHDDPASAEVDDRNDLHGDCVKRRRFVVRALASFMSSGASRDPSFRRRGNGSVGPAFAGTTNKDHAHDRGVCFEARPAGAPQHEVRWMIASRKAPHPEEAAKRPPRRAIGHRLGLGGAHLKARRSTGGPVAHGLCSCPAPWARARSSDGSAGGGAEAAAASSSRRTMTGELTDLFVDRADGVRQLPRPWSARIRCSRAHLLRPARPGSCPPPRQSRGRVRSPRQLARQRPLRRIAVPCGLFLDIGTPPPTSCRSAIVPVEATGYSDDERMVGRRAGLYRRHPDAGDGAGRPVPFAGEIQPLMPSTSRPRPTSHG